VLSGESPVLVSSSVIIARQVAVEEQFGPKRAEELENGPIEAIRKDANFCFSEQQSVSLNRPNPLLQQGSMHGLCDGENNTLTVNTTDFILV
jgi:hypothetical protein